MPGVGCILMPSGERPLSLVPCWLGQQPCEQILTTPMSDAVPLIVSAQPERAPGPHTATQE